MDTKRLRWLDTTPEMLALAAVAYFAILCNFRFWREVLEIVIPDDLRQIAVLVTLPLVLTSLGFLLLLPASFRRTLKPVLAMLFFANALALCFMNTYHIYIDRSMLRNALQTDWREATELLDMRMAGYLLLFGILPTMLLQRVHLRATSLRAAITRRLASAAVVIVAVSVGMLSPQYMFLAREHREAAYLITSQNYVLAAIGLLRRQTPRPDPTTRVAIGSDAAQCPGRAAPAGQPRTGVFPPLSTGIPALYAGPHDRNAARHQHPDLPPRARHVRGVPQPEADCRAICQTICRVTPW